VLLHRLPSIVRGRLKRSAGSLPGRIWKRPRGKGVFDVDLDKSWENYEDERLRRSMEQDQYKKYFEAFRMKPPLFDKMCELLRPHVEKDSTPLRETVPLRKRVAIGIQRLAHTYSFQMLAWTHGLGKSTVQYICYDVFEGLCALLPQYISFPTGDRLRGVIEGFRALKHDTGLPQCAGAVDGTHLEIAAPHDNPEAYVNRKGHHSIVLQACVDSEGLFTDVCVGWPGRVHDARIFKNSTLFTRASNGTILRDIGPVTIDGEEVWPFLCGDAAYGSSTFMVPPFKGKQLPPDQDWYNYRQSGTRIAVEKAFGRLKGRFQSLGNKLKYQDLKTVIQHITACCVLHNYLEMGGEEYNEALTPATDQNETDGVVGAGADVARGLGIGGARLREVICREMEKCMPPGYIRRQNFYTPANRRTAGATGNRRAS
jgi:hypothetical protein